MSGRTLPALTSKTVGCDKSKIIKYRDIMEHQLQFKGLRLLYNDN